MNCPKCGATILVPSPEESPTGEAFAAPAADIAPPDFAAADQDVANSASTEAAPADAGPADAVGFDVLGDVANYDRPRGAIAAPHTARKRAPAADLPLDDGERIVISRRVVYFQAVLLAIVGLLALAAGYLIGSGTRLHGP